MTAPNPVIDMWAPLWPIEPLTNQVAENFPEQMLGYIRIFLRGSPDLDSVRAVLKGFKISEGQLRAELERAGISRSLVTGFDEKTYCGKTLMPNDHVASLAERMGDAVIPFAGADIGRGMPAVRELVTWVRDHDFRGLSLRPFMIGLPADDRRYYPFYAKCVELDIPVSIHASANWSEQRHSELGHPRAFETVANDFPELKLILSHAGYPWVLEAALLAWKHPNVYLELGAHRPKYLARSGTGWEPLMRFGPNQLRKKVLYGTGWFLLGTRPTTLIDEFNDLPLPEGVKADWLYGNAATLLGLSPTNE